MALRVRGRRQLLAIPQVVLTTLHLMRGNVHRWLVVTTTVNALPNLSVQTSCGAGLGTGSIATTANASAGGALSYAINGVADADGNQTNLNNGTYTVLITENPSTCTATQTVSVNCNCPTITIAGALSICQNTAATYTQTGGNAGGQWSVSPSGAGTVDANGNFVPSGGFSGAASISYAANGCTGNLSININPLNTPTFTPIPAFCSGTAAPSLSSTSNNGIAGTWSPATISNTTSGTYNFTPNAGQCASAASLSVTVDALPNLSVQTSCGAGLGTGNIATTANASAGGALSYAINGVADADGNQTSLNNGTYTVLITENPSTCTAAQTVSVNCNCPTITIAGALSICQNTAATYTQTGGNAGGQWSVNPSGAGTVDANGNFVPSGGFSGAASISYAANGCTGNLSININPLTTPTFTPIPAFCSGTAAPSLPNTSNNGIAGTWSPATISNTTSGTYNFTPNAGQCASVASLSVTIDALPNLSVQTSCGAGLGTGNIATTANASAGGALSYAINGVADADGNETNLNNGTYTVLITENPSTCTTAQTVSVNCNCPTISIAGAASICQNAAATYTQTGGNADGQWSVNPSGAGAVDANGNFVPSGGFSGAASISYAANGCTGNLSININPLTTPTFTPIPAFCSGTAAPTLPSTSNNGIAGTWSPTTISNTTSGTYNFTPNSGQCASVAAVTTTVNPSVTPTFTPIPAFCSGTTAPSLPSTSNNGIAGTWLPTVVSNTTSGTYNFTPNAGQCASAATVTTTVNPSVTPTFTPIPAFCSGTAAPTLPNTSNNGIAGTWLPTVVSNTTSGTYNFTPNAGQCASAATVTTTVNPSVTPTFTPIPAFCSGTAAPTLPNTSNNGIAGTWLPTVVSNTTSGTYNFTPNAGQCASAAAVTTTVNALPNLNVQTSCGAGLGTGSIATTANASAGGALSYAINGVADADGSQTNLNNGTYTVLITENPSACTATQTVSVNCNCPTITIAGALSICQNTAATYTQTGGNAGGQWSVSPSGAGTVDANGNFVPSGGFSGAASISYAANGCTGNLSININPLNTPTFTPIPAFCSGTAAPSLSSTSNNGIAGTWSPATISNTTSGTYNFTPNAGQCASAASLSVTVDALPNLSVQTSCGAGLGTGNIATTANASAGGALSYAINGVADADGNQTSLNNGTYTVLITENPSTCTAAQTVSVNCNCPTITIAGALSICQNTAATYTQTGGNAGGQWSVNPSGAGTVDANGNFVPSGGFSGAASISYAANGCTGNLSININPLTTPTFTPIPAFCSGTAAPSLPNTSNNGIAGTWSPATISNTTSGTYNFTPNAGQCASVASLSVTIDALPNLSVQTSCGAGLGTGNIATTANASAGGALSYTINGVADADGNQMSLNNGTYTVLITENPSTCTAAQTVSVNCNCPSIVVNGALSICQNTAATYTQTGGNAGGQWAVSPSGAGTVDANGNFVPSGGFSGAASISYAANGCTGNLSININPLNTPTFTPIPAFCSGTAAPTLPSTSNNGIAGTWLPTVVSNTTSGTYSFTPNAGQCASAVAVTTTVNALPNLNVLTDCGTNPSNGSGMLTITASVPDGSALEYAIDGVNFQASNVFSNLNNGAYIVTVRAISTSCIATASTNISCACIAPTLTVSSPNPICQNATGNATISLSNNIINTTGTPPTYYSTLALANAGGMGDVVNPDAVGAGTYFVRSNNAADSTCFSIEPITVVINNLPAANISGSQNYCVGDAASALSANGGISYVWNNGTMGNTLIPSTNNATNTTYTVTVTDANTCQNTAEITVNVSEVSVILSGNTLIELGDSTTLHATAITLPNSTLSYTWLPTGLCQDTDCSSITVSPNINGIYSVTVSNEWGCLATDNISLQVTTQNTLVIPNAFSPNGDNVNEVFHIGGTNIAQFELLIYDRWGQKTFETQSVDLADGWDGKYPNGIDAELAVYVYYLNVTFTDGKTQFAKGNVTLVR
jgi:gliding motility-associated-like protein